MKNLKAEKEMESVAALQQRPTKKVVTEYRDVEVDLIMASPTNPRKSFPEGALAELAESIRLYGIKQPILIRPLPMHHLKEPDLVSKTWRILTIESDGTQQEVTEATEKEARNKMESIVNKRYGKTYEIVCGERRYRAARLAKLTSVPCSIEALGDQEAREIQQVENFQREDLNAIEEAQGYKALMEDFHYSVKDLQAKLGKSRSHIFAKLALLKLSPAVRKALAEGKIEASVAELVGRLPGKSLQEQATKRIVFPPHGDPLSFRQAKEWLEENFTYDLKAAKFDTKRVYDVPKVFESNGFTCLNCPRRSGNAKDEFPDIKSPDVCTDPTCFKLRGEEHGKELAAELAKKGARVLTAKETKDMWRDDGSFMGYQTDYERLDETTYSFGESKSYKKLLGEHAPNIVAIAPDGEAIRVFPKKDLTALLEKAGVKRERSSGGGRSAADKKKDALVKRRKEIAGQVTDEALDKIAGHASGWLTPKVWALLAESAYEHTSIDDHAFVAKRRGLAKTQGEARPGIEKFLKENANDAQALSRMMLELLLVGLPINRWEGKYVKRFTDVCALAKIDLKEYEEVAEKKIDTKDAKGTKAVKKGGGK